MPKVSIIIVNWNTRDLLQQCLKSICDAAITTTFDIIVIDNASHDDSAEMVRVAYPQVTLVKNLNNAGFARANNQGLALSRADYAWLLNSDTLVLSGALEAMLAYAEANPDVAMIGCRLLDEQGRVDHFPKTLPTLSSEALRVLELAKLGDRFSHHGFLDRYRSGDVDRIKGACMLVRREALASVGLLDESLFMYAEEDEWCYRMRKGGWRICYLPGPAIVHLGGRSTRQVEQGMFLQLHKSKVLFFRKCYGNAQARALKLIFWGGYGLRLLAACFAGVTRLPHYDRARSKRASYAQLLQQLSGW